MRSNVRVALALALLGMASAAPLFAQEAPVDPEFGELLRLADEAN